LDCVFLDGKYCTAAAIELDPDTGCRTYQPRDDIELEDWDEHEDLDDWDDIEEDDDDEDLWIDEEEDDLIDLEFDEDEESY
jgi:hypothetical protein